MGGRGVIVTERTQYRLYESDLKTLLGLRRKDRVERVDVVTDREGFPVTVTIQAVRPSRGRWIKKIVTGR